MCIHIRITPFGNLRINSYLLIPAAYHVLLRLLMPRHSPYALLSLTIFELCLILLIFMLIAGFLPDFNFRYCRSFFPHLHYFCFSLFNFQVSFLARSLLLVGTSGLEPPTSRLSGVRSNHLSYAPIMLYITALKLFAFLRPLVEMRRIELLTPCLQSRCSPS